MSGRHSQPDESRVHARRATLLAGAGVAGLVSAIAAAPLLDAAPAGAATGAAATASSVATATDGQPLPAVATTSTTTTAPETPVTGEPETSTTAPETSEPETSEPETGTTIPAEPTSAPISSESSPVVADFGVQKFRVGVERDPKSFIPDTINTVGTTFTVTETGPNAPADNQFICASEDETTDDATDATFCPGTGPAFNRTVAGRRIAARTEPTAGFPFNVYYAQPGDTVTVTQDTVVDGLVIDSQTITLAPCTAEPGEAVCDDGEALAIKSTDLIFTDAGLPPKTEDDTATTTTNTPVTIDVGANDETYHGSTATYDAPVTDETIAADPAHGTVQVAPLQGGKAETGRALAAAVPAQPKITYTPNSGFVGVDKFKYTLHTRNGVSTATVTVTIAGGATSTPTRLATPVAPETSASTSTSFGFDPSSSTRAPDPFSTTTTSAPLATTGTDGTPLVGYGLAMIGAGAGAVVVGRHRRGRSRRAH